MTRHWLSLLLIVAPLFQIYAVEADRVKEQLPLYFWDARATQGFANFGDALSEVLVERIVGHKVQIVENPYSNEKKLLGMGSILSYAGDGDLIWGTGVNGKTPMSSYRFTNLDIRAVRGPLTRSFLMELGIYCPEIYGDPTLLFPICFPEFQKSSHPSREYVIVPHFSDEYLFLGNENMVSAKANWQQVVSQILDSQFVISSALSGVIIAEAFGIPARLLIVDNSSNTENLFKYQDYYYGTNRFDFQYASSVEQALEMGGEPLPICNLDELYRAFPFEFFKDSIP